MNIRITNETIRNGWIVSYEAAGNDTKAWAAYKHEDVKFIVDCLLNDFDPVFVDEGLPSEGL